MVPVKHPVIIGNFSSKIAATDALMMGGIRTCVDRHAKQGLSVWCSSQTHDLWGRFQQRKNCLAKDINNKKNTIKNIITKKTTQQEESPEKKEKEQENNNKQQKKHIESKPGFPKFLFLFFVCLFCCCFVTLCFLFFMLLFSCFWFSSLILFVCSVAFYLFIQPSFICAVGLITQDIWTLLRHQKVSVRICQDGCVYWQNLKVFF